LLPKSSGFHRIADTESFMQQNLYDQACRYLVMLDPVGFLCWLLGLQRAEFSFFGWLDTRAIAHPGESDRTSDMVAHLANLQEHGMPWALALEFQIVPDFEMFGRALDQIATIWRFVRPDHERGSRFHVGAAVVNLTGRVNCSRQMHWPAAKLTTNLIVVERNLEYEYADELLKGVESGHWPRSLLAFIPLMIGGGEPSKIDWWMALAGAELNTKHRSDYAGLALLFADRVGRKAIWEGKLKGWNVTESAWLNEFIAKGEATGEARGEVKGRMTALLELLNEKFQSLPGDLETAIRETTDVNRLRMCVSAAVKASTMQEFRQASGI
jgi:hypothetical protein